MQPVLDWGRPHHVDPDKKKIRIAFAYKNFAAHQGVSHIGLGVGVDNTRRTLEDQGIWCTVWPIAGTTQKPAIVEIAERLRHHSGHGHGHPAISHVVISAAWIRPMDIATLCRQFETVQFVVLIHSNVGFLQADTNGVANINGYLELEQAVHNFQVAGNSRTFVDWVQRTYQVPCVYLPNLYHLKHVVLRPKRPWSGGRLRIGCFGAMRLQKNLMTSVAAAMEISTLLRATDLEVWVSTGRPGPGSGIIQALENLIAGLPNAKLVDNKWQSWAAFLKTIKHMDLMLQVSYTESFNVVTADGIHAGVPTVVSSAIEWAPDRWIADSDDANDVARVGCALLQDPFAVADGLAALTGYVQAGIQDWFTFLRVPRGN